MRRVCHNSNASTEIERVVPFKVELPDNSILHALLSKCRDTREGRSGLVGPESYGRGGLSEIIYWRH